MNIVIFGPPGAGKGTQSKFIVNKYNLFQLSTGELLRKEIKDETKLGSRIASIINSGELVSDDIVSNLIENFISKDIYKNRLIFDGYPRNLNQARNLDKLLKQNNQKIDVVLQTVCKTWDNKKRIFERQSQEKRADDNENIAIKRYNNYEKSIKEVIDYYKQLKLLKVVNGERPINEINGEISHNWNYQGVDFKWLLNINTQETWTHWIYGSYSRNKYSTE